MNEFSRKLNHLAFRQWVGRKKSRVESYKAALLQGRSPLEGSSYCSLLYKKGTQLAIPAENPRVVTNQRTVSDTMIGFNRSAWPSLCFILPQGAIPDLFSGTGKKMRRILLLVTVNYFKKLRKYHQNKFFFQNDVFHLNRHHQVLMSFYCVVNLMIPF